MQVAKLTYFIANNQRNVTSKLTKSNALDIFLWLVPSGELLSNLDEEEMRKDMFHMKYNFIDVCITLLAYEIFLRFIFCFKFYFQ